MSVKVRVFLENPWYPESTTLATTSGTSVGVQGSTEHTERILFSNPRIIIHDHDGQNCCVFCQQEGWCNITYILSDAFRYSSHSSLAFLNTSRGRLSCLEEKKCCSVDWRPLIGHRASWNSPYFLQVQSSHFCICVLCMSIPPFIPPFPHPLTVFLGMICL